MRRAVVSRDVTIRPFSGGGRGVFPPPAAVWRTLTGRVSIKQGSTMKKIGGPKGQVGGGQQGEVRLNGNSSDVGCVCSVRGLHAGRGEGVCVSEGVQALIVLLSSRERPETRAATSAKSPFSPSSSSFSSSPASPSSLPQHFFFFFFGGSIAADLAPPASG